jgi:hypothetical protein
MVCADTPDKYHKLVVVNGIFLAEGRRVIRVNQASLDGVLPTRELFFTGVVASRRCIEHPRHGYIFARSEVRDMFCLEIKVANSCTIAAESERWGKYKDGIAY